MKYIKAVHAKTHLEYKELRSSRDSQISGGGYDSSGNSCRGAGFIINLLTGELGNPVMPKR